MPINFSKIRKKEGFMIRLGRLILNHSSILVEGSDFREVALAFQEVEEALDFLEGVSISIWKTCSDFSKDISMEEVFSKGKDGHRVKGREGQGDKDSTQGIHSRTGASREVILILIFEGIFSTMNRYKHEYEDIVFIM